MSTTTINSAQYTQLLSQLTSKFDNYNVDTNNVYGSIFDIFKAAGTLANKDSNSSQNENEIQDLVTKILNFIVGLLNQAGKAQQETTASGNKVQSTLSQYKTNRQATTDAIDAILDEIENTDMAAIAEALDKIKALGGDENNGLGQIQKEVEARKEKIQECIKNIKEAQANNDLGGVITNLATIESLRGEISTLISGIADIEAQINEQTTVVAKHTVAITNKQSQVVDLLNKEIQNAAESAQAQGIEGAKNTAFVTTGVVEGTTGETMEAAAAASGAVPIFGASMSSQMHVKAQDLIQAGQTHVSNGGENLTAVGESLGAIGNGMADVSRFATTIGSVITNAGKLIGAYATEVKPLITSIGSVKEVELQMQNLEKVVSADLTNILAFKGYDSNQKNSILNDINIPQTSYMQDGRDIGNKSAKKDDEEESQTLEELLKNLKTPEFTFGANV